MLKTRPRVSEAADHIDEVELDADQLVAFLAEYRAAKARVDESAAAIFERRADAIECAKGCHACCVDGLAVLEVEAAEIALHLQTADPTDQKTPAPPPGGCAFLDAAGACTIYPVRPLVCRTHGLPLKMATDDDNRSQRQKTLRVVDDVSVCDLNFRDAAIASADILDAERIQMLLTVVNARFCANVGLPAEGRTPLAELASDDI